MSRNLSGTHNYALRPYTVQGMILTVGNYILLLLLYFSFVSSYISVNVAIHHEKQEKVFVTCSRALAKILS